jgi:hypothetical protein
MRSLGKAYRAVRRGGRGRLFSAMQAVICFFTGRTTVYRTYRTRKPNHWPLIGFLVGVAIVSCATEPKVVEKMHCKTAMWHPDATMERHLECLREQRAWEIWNRLQEIERIQEQIEILEQNEWRNDA